MNLLYKGEYLKRFKAVIKLLKEKNAIELCFGDTYIADHCFKNKISWKGYDINAGFVEHAKSKGYNAELSDLNTIPGLEKAEVCIITGSLYHFHSGLEALIKKMFESAPRILISEPVINLSDQTGIIGKLAKRSASVKGKEQEFRYTETTLIKELESLSNKLNFTFTIRDRISKDIIIELNK
ncbi:MAG: hypothetical protein K0S44_160 [Bacteroidetes bacterium]|jgi:hypothetical protein|nr:hypothetical protein [Bacteroidota bacterium]